MRITIIKPVAVNDKVRFNEKAVKEFTDLFPNSDFLKNIDYGREYRVIKTKDQCSGYHWSQLIKVEGIEHDFGSGYLALETITLSYEAFQTNPELFTKILECAKDKE